MDLYVNRNFAYYRDFIQKLHTVVGTYRTRVVYRNNILYTATYETFEFQRRNEEFWETLK
jgi:hypothetical protein